MQQTQQKKHKIRTIFICILGASLYGESFKAYTIHKWCGLEDGRHQNEGLLHLLQTDERFEAAKKKHHGN